MSEELKPCPFCGGPAKHGTPTISGNDAWLHIHCANRCSVAPSAHGSSVVWYWSTVQSKNVRAYSDEEAMQQATELAYSRWNRRAQPAEAQGVDVVAWRYTSSHAFGRRDRHWHYQETFPEAGARQVQEIGRLDALVLQSDHLAALSAVTAERDRLQKKWARVESERDQLRAEVERWKGYASNWESVAHNRYRKLKDILRSLASDKALSVFPAPCPERELPVPCEVIHDDDVLLVIHQRAAMAAKEV